MRATKSSSTQPPDTEPAKRPSPATASMAPTGRGEEPQVFTTVERATGTPSASQPRAARSTSRSTLSMGGPPSGLEFGRADRQPADALAGGGKERIRHRRGDRRHS